MSRLGDDEIIARLAARLDPGGLDLVAAMPASRADGDDLEPSLRPGALLAGARTMIVVGSGGRALWERFVAWIAEDVQGRLREEADPLERYVRGWLERGSELLAAAGLRWRLFEPTLAFAPRLDFRRLAVLAGLGSPSPLGLIVHPRFGPWWALRGAWLVDRALPPTPQLDGPCLECEAPCRAFIPPGSEGTLAAATPAARLACCIDEPRYSDEQLAYHSQPAGRERLLARFAGRA